MHERQRFEGHRPIGTAHAKNTLSSLINKVAYGKTRVVLESRGKPKAALISTEDLEKPERLENRAAAPKRRLNILLRAQALRARRVAGGKSYSRFRGTLGSTAGATQPWNLDLRRCKLGTETRAAGTRQRLSAF